MASKLYVGGLSYSTTGETLREYFSQCGTVESASVITDKFSGQSRGFGFIEMSTAEEAQRAIAELNGKELEGAGVPAGVAGEAALAAGTAAPTAFHRRRSHSAGRVFSRGRGTDGTLH